MVTLTLSSLAGLFCFFNVESQHELGWFAEFLNEFWKELVFWSVTSLLALLFTMSRFKWVRAGIMSSAHLLYPDKRLADEIGAGQRHFIPNRFIIKNKHGETLHTASKNEIGNIIPNLINLTFEQKECPFFLLIAPTGVGKTTFLSAVYAHYRSTTKWKRVPHLYFGKAHDSRTLDALDQLIKEGKAANSIVILDGLDEFIIKKGGDPGQFWSYFSSRWEDELLEKRLSKFRTVIVSVRDQFFQSAEMEDVQFNQFDGRKIILLPFQDEQWRIAYIEKRYPVSNHIELSKRDDIKFIVNKLYERGSQIIEKPIILNFMEYVVEAYRSRKAEFDNVHFFSNDYIYGLIVDRWIRREGKSEDGITEKAYKLILKYCKLLAYNITTNQQEAQYSKSQLEEFEHALNIVADLRGLQGRSLLIKIRDRAETADRYYDIKENYRFIHDTFLEYFLVLYIEDHPEVEPQVPFDRHNFALWTLFGRRWASQKHNLPKFSYISTKDAYYEVSAQFLRSLYDYFVSLIDNKQAMARFLVHRNLTRFLTVEDPTWQHAFDEIPELAITTENFWNTEQDRPYNFAEYVMYLLAPKIKYIHFENVPLKTEHIACFQYCKNIEVLNIWDTGLSKYLVSKNDDDLTFLYEGLEYFKESARSLTVLQLPGTGIDSNDLSNFLDSRSIIQLNLSRNFLGNGDFTIVSQILANNRDLRFLEISLNQLTDEHISRIADVPELYELNLTNNLIKGSGLSVFQSSANTLKKLYLDANEIEEQWLSIFQNFTVLEEINLGGNVITGYGLQYFQSSLFTLKKLTLSRAHIQHTEYLAKFSHIVEFDD